MNDTPQLVRMFMPVDGGPIYQETPLELSHWLVEPWNALSSLFIIMPGIYFFFKLRGQYSRHRLLTWCIPLLILGGLGSTFFHAFRTESIFLVMDVAPTALLFLIVSGYFWYRVIGNPWIAAGLIVVLMAIPFSFFFILPRGSLSINLSYAVRGTIFFLPLVLILARTHYKYALMIFSALVFFGLALLFRSVDKDVNTVLPMGSHFLWHVCTGVGGLLVAEYIYRLDGLRLDTLRSFRHRFDPDGLE
jgi:hemolysin III